jgi:hypothetical protein
VRLWMIDSSTFICPSPTLLMWLKFDHFSLNDFVLLFDVIAGRLLPPSPRPPSRRLPRRHKVWSGLLLTSLAYYLSCFRMYLFANPLYLIARHGGAQRLNFESGRIFVSIFLIFAFSNR